ncbi:hypothetical protein K6119_04830 [Paracrocinitomix mangrovi]|uniref:hypothetical protein n=1 Tax=Paracrocinitomix mangrovi TaxID=2862509 RepID=UPI001C8F1104|nr:hypothetical protein [Paracrocinitomix mangrovi]UKN02839.1 hypothetical protein K6119_04830 [Paracrocinitomix mangrovi]
MDIKTHWSNQKGDTHYRIDISIDNSNITIAEYTGHWKAEIGGSWSLKEFTTGKCDEFVFYGFQEDILKEVHNSVKQILESSSNS